MALNAGFVDAVKIEMRDMIKREPQLANDPLASLINQGRTKAYRSTQRFVKPLDFEDISSPILSNDPLAISSTDATRRSQILPTSPEYTIPEFYTRASYSEAGHIRVAVPRILQRALGQNSSEAAKALSKEILSAAQRALLRYTINGLKADVIQNPILDNAGTGRTTERFPLAQNLLARPSAITGGGGQQAVLTPEAKMWADSILANLCQVSLHSPTPVGESINKSNKIYIFSNTGWTSYMTANLQIYGDRDYFGDSYYQKGLANVTKMGGDTYITIPDAFFPQAPITAIGTGTRDNDLAVFGVGDLATLVSNPSFLIEGSAYRAATAQQGRASTRGLYSCFVLYPDAYEFGETEQYTDLGLEINIDPAQSNEKYIYAIVSRESMRMWDQGVVRLWFGARNQAVRTAVS